MAYGDSMHNLTVAREGGYNLGKKEAEEEIAKLRRENKALKDLLEKAKPMVICSNHATLAYEMTLAIEGEEVTG